MAETAHKTTPVHYFSLTGACLSWGLSFVATKYALEAVGAMSLVLARFALGALVLLIISPLLTFRPVARADFKFFLLLCAFEPGLYYIFETYGLQRTDPTSAALIIAAIPVLVMVIARIAVLERLTAAKMAGAVISIAGVFVVTSGGLRASMAGATLLGNVLIMGAAVAGSCFTVVLSRLAKRYDPPTMTRFQVLFGACFFLPLGVTEFASQGRGIPDAPHLAALAFLAVVPGVGAFLMYNHALSAIEAGRAAVFINTIPVFTALAAWAFLQQEFTLFHLAGGLLTLGGVALANYGAFRRQECVE